MIEGMTGAADFGDNPPRPFLRKSTSADTLESTKFRLASLDRRIAWLAERGLRPHPTVLKHRADLLGKIAQFESSAAI